MIVRIAARGRSFTGAGAYYLHDKQADTSERVAWTHVENVGTQDAFVAFRWMAATAIAANEAKTAAHAPGRRIEKPVWTIALSWSPEETPTKEHMVDTARSWMASRKLSSHQAVFVSHQDEAYHHLHIVVNLVDTETLKVNRAAVSHATRQSSLWAQRYEQAHGVHCQQRILNNEKRAAGQRVRYDGSEHLRAHVTEAFETTESGAAFVAALQQRGYAIAQGRRLVVIDREGKPHALFRQVEGISSSAIKQRLEGLEFQSLKDRSETDSATRSDARNKRKHQQQQAPPEYFDRDQQERESDERVIDAGIRHGDIEARQERGEQGRSDALRLLQDRHIAERGQLSDRHLQSRLLLDARLDAQYGEAQKRLAQRIADAEKLLQRRFVLNRAAKLQTLENDKLSAANIDQRLQEAIDALDAQTARERRGFEERAAHESLVVEAGFPSREPHREMQQPQPAPERPSLSTSFDEAADAKESRRAAYMERTHGNHATARERPSGPQLG